MTTTLLPEFTESTFEPLVKKLEEGRQRKDISAEEVRQWLLVCDMASKVVDWVSESTEMLLNCGAEQRFLIGFFDGVAKITGYLVNSAFPDIRTIASGEALSKEEKCVGVRKLDEQISRAKAVHRELTALRTWLDQASAAGPSSVAEFARIQTLQAGSV